MASLLDDKMRGIGGRKPPAGPGKSQGLKLALALALFVVAGVVFAWYQGWIFAAAEKHPAPTAEEVKQHDEAIKRSEEIIKKNPNVIQTGS